MSKGEIIAAFSTGIAFLLFSVTLLSFLYNRERNKVKDTQNSTCASASNHVQLVTVQGDFKEFKKEVKTSLKELSEKVGSLAVYMAAVKTEVSNCSKLINTHFGK